MNPIVQALGKIRDICAFTLRMSNGNQTVLSTLDTMPDGPKTKHCKPRRRGGMSGYLAGPNSAVNSYFPCTSGASSPTPSASFGPSSCPLQQDDSHQQDVDPLVSQLSRDSPLPELQDNLQLEMIELDTITGSREASPSHANPSMLDLPFDPPVNQDSIVPLADVKTSFSPEDNAQVLTESADTAQPVSGQEENGRTEELPPVPEPPSSEPGVANSVQPDYADPIKLNGTSSSPPNEVVTDVKPETESIAEPSGSETQGAETLTLPDSASPGVKDSKPAPEQGGTKNPEPSPVHPELSSEETVKVDESHSDSTGSKRKGQALDKESSDLDTAPDNRKSPVKSSPDAESLVTKTDATAKEDVQRKYKRLRRSVPKQRI